MRVALARAIWSTTQWSSAPVVQAGTRLDGIRGLTYAPAGSPEEERCGVEVHRGADGQGAPPASGGHHGRRDLPEARDQQHHVLSIEEAGRQHANPRTPAFAQREPQTPEVPKPLGDNFRATIAVCTNPRWWATRRSAARGRRWAPRHERGSAGSWTAPGRSRSDAQGARTEGEPRVFQPQPCRVKVAGSRGVAAAPTGARALDLSPRMCPLLNR